MLLLILVFSVGLGLIVACQADVSEEPLPDEYAGLENPYAGDENAAETGMGIFEARCERCHGGDARGEGSAPDLVASADQHNPDYLFWWVSSGGDSLTMPSFSSVLSEDQIWQVITYITQLD
jgi:mono/diheme cytochrome c family protein